MPRSVRVGCVTWSSLVLFSCHSDLHENPQLRLTKVNQMIATLAFVIRLDEGFCIALPLNDRCFHTSRKDTISTRQALYATYNCSPALVIPRIHTSVYHSPHTASELNWKINGLCAFCSTTHLGGNTTIIVSLMTNGCSDFVLSIHYSFELPLDERLIIWTGHAESFLSRAKVE